MINRLFIELSPYLGSPLKPTQEAILGLIFEAFSEVNQDLPADHQLQSSAETRISLGGVIDSIHLLTILVGVEDRIQKLYNSKLDLLADPDLLSNDGPLKTAGTLATFLLSRTEGRPWAKQANN